VSFLGPVSRLSDTFHLDEGDFFDEFPGWSYVVGLCSLNVIETVQRVYPPSDPGGIRINLGPLLWTLFRVSVGPSLEGIVWAFLLVGSGLLPVDGGGETVRIVVCKRGSDSEAITRRLCGAAF
jgi:hypothetical protein